MGEKSVIPGCRNLSKNRSERTSVGGALCAGTAVYAGNWGLVFCVMESVNLGVGVWKEKSDYFALRHSRVSPILAKAKDKA